MNIDPSTILDHFIDWKDFEKFVAEMYKDSADVEVQHDVTLTGKYNDKRQVDVLVTQKTKLHTYKTIIECKFLSKEKVNRPIIDVLAAAIEDLDANKGVIITTVGFEAGAIEYAKGKNIDIFLIRNVLEEEWGNTGRKIKLWLQFFSAQMENFSSSSIRYFSPSGSPPPKEHINLDIKLFKDFIPEDKHQLFSLPDLKKGPNLVQMLINVQQDILKNLNEQTIGFINTNPDESITRVFRTNAKFEFSSYPYRNLPYGNGYAILDNLNVSFLLSITQSKIEIDRAEKFNYVLMVENYITKQKNFVAKAKDTNNITLSPPLTDKPIGDDLQNGAIIKINMDYYVGITKLPGVEIENINNIDVKFEQAL